MRTPPTTEPLTSEEIKKALSAPSDFGYFGGNEEMFKTWSLGPVIEHRDSDVLTRSNARVLIRTLEARKDFDGQWSELECNHWAVGWVKHLSFRVLDEKGQPCEIGAYLRDWFTYLKEQYPVADENDYSELEEEEANRTWGQMSIKDRVETCKRYGVSILAARHDYYPSDDSGSLRNYLVSP